MALTSSSVSGLVQELRGGDVSTFAIVQRLLDTHHYGGRPAAAVVLGDPPAGAKKKLPEKWISEAEALYDLADGEFLDGRRVILALALLDKHLHAELSKDGFLDACQDEIAQRSGLQFSAKGKRLFAARRRLRVAIPLLDDAPAENDELDRAILARVLARRIRRARGTVVVFGVLAFRERLRRLVAGRWIGLRPSGAESARATLFHIDGPWGSGKTSLFNFVARELRGKNVPKADRWVVVTFNAWQYQRLEPPWWWLATALHSGAIRQLLGFDRLRAIKLGTLWLWWRIRDGWVLYILLTASAVTAFLLWRSGFFGENVTTNAEIAESLAKIAAFVAVWWGAIKALSRWLLSDTSSMGAAVLERSPDPLRLVRRRFARTVRSIERPVAIYIDDLDRCQPDYVVRLLEGIQTLFIDQPVIYIVAADGMWLSEAYTAAYTKGEGDGQSVNALGARFLEKAFQHTVRLARIPDDVRERYWRRLLESDTAKRPTEAELLKAEQAFDGLGSAEAIIDTLRAEEEANTIDRYALRLAATGALEARIVEAGTHAMLDHFSGLLEGNPRAMKKLVNAYGIELETRLPDLPGEEQILRQLALWTIVSLRWPPLASYLESLPDDVELICAAAANGESANASDELKAYLKAPGVRDVFEGKNVEPAVSLDASAVRLFVGAAPATDADAVDSGDTR